MVHYTEIPIVSFDSPAKWRVWLEENAQREGVWVRIFKKHSGIASITYDEALDEALCFGWIDSQMKKYDEQSYIQKFTPRRAKSIWSKINTAHIERLIQEGRMAPAGLKQVAEAKEDGRWHAAYNPPSTMTIPDEFLKMLKKNKKARQFFDSLSKANTYAIAWRLQTAKKPETREHRMKEILQMLSEGRTFHP